VGSEAAIAFVNDWYRQQWGQMIIAGQEDGLLSHLG
jgi:hypothetical protein